MGKESAQIRKHIDEERERLEMNIAKLEGDFDVARTFVTKCWKSPLTLVGIALGILIVIDTKMSTHRHKKTRETNETTARDIAA